MLYDGKPSISIEVKGMEGQQLHSLQRASLSSDNKCAHAKFDETKLFMVNHFIFKLTWINGVRVFQNGGLSVCIH